MHTEFFAQSTGKFILVSEGKFSKSRKFIKNLKFACNQREFHFKCLSSTTVDSTFSKYFAALKRTMPLLFHTTCSSVDTLPSCLDSWDRYKGLKRQHHKDYVNIGSSLWNPEAIFSDVIGYPPDCLQCLLTKNMIKACKSVVFSGVRSLMNIMCKFSEENCTSNFCCF